MKKLLLLLVILSSFGCSSTKYYPTYETRKIARPEAPKLLKLDPTQHIGSPDNVDKLTENIQRLQDNNSLLNRVIDKYEIQAAPKENTNGNNGQ
jgi:LAS superfamily LD-carboxypeptidase LdcB